MLGVFFAFAEPGLKGLVLVFWLMSGAIAVAIERMVHCGALTACLFLGGVIGFLGWRFLGAY